MAAQNEVSIVLTADATNLKAQLAGARQDIESSVGRGGPLGAAVQQSGLLFDQFGRRAVAALDTIGEKERAVAQEMRAFVAPDIDWSKTIRGTDDVTRSHREQQKALREGLGLTRTFSDALLGQIPVLGSEAGALIAVARETRGMAVGFTAGALAVTAAAIVFQRFLKAADEVAATVVKAQVAVKSLDFNAALSGLQGMAEAQQASANNWDIIGKKGPASIDSIAASLRILQGETMSTVTARTVAWANATEKLWQSYGRLDATAKANLTTLRAQASELENLKDAASVEGLATVNARITQNLREQVAAEVEVLQAEKAKNAAAMMGQIEYLAGQGKIEESLKVGRVLREQNALKDQEIDAKRTAGAAAVAKAETDGARSSAAALAGRFDAEARLAELKGTAVQKEIAASAQTLEIAQRRITQEAQFNAQGLTNLDQYYDQRVAKAREAAAQEIATLDEVYQKTRQSLVVQFTAQPAGSVAAEQIGRQIVELDQRTADKRVDIARQAGLQIADIETQRVAAIDANNARIFQLESTFMQQRVALGRASGQEELASLKQAAQNALLPIETRRQAEVAFYEKKRELAAQQLAYEKGIGQATIAQEIAYYTELAGAANTSLETRRQAAVQAQQLIRKAEQDTFDLARAQGRMTEADAVNHARAVALSWKDGTQQRIDAEKNFATQARAFWDGLAQAGRSLQDMAMQGLVAQGKAITQANISGEIDRIKTQASSLNEIWQRGGALTKDQIDLVRKWADANGDLASRGASQFSAMAAANQKLDDGIHGVVTSVESLAGRGFQQAGDAARQFGRAGDQAFDTVGTSLDDLVQQTQSIGNLVGTNLARGLQTAGGQIVNVFDGITSQLRARAGTTFDGIFSGLAEAFERRLIQMIDSAANRN
jgi:hypothetical protein